MTEEEYRLLSKMLVSCHWYCKYCEKDALTSIRNDREIEEKCKLHMVKLNERIDVLKTTLASKEDENFVETVDTKSKQNSQKISGLASDLEQKIEFVSK